MFTLLLVDTLKLLMIQWLLLEMLSEEFWQSHMTVGLEHGLLGLTVGRHLGGGGHGRLTGDDLRLWAQACGELAALGYLLDRTLVRV